MNNHDVFKTDEGFVMYVGGEYFNVPESATRMSREQLEVSHASGIFARRGSAILAADGAKPEAVEVPDHSDVGPQDAQN